MSEAMPNSKGPAKVQMSPEVAASLGLTPTPEAVAPGADLIVPITVHARLVGRASLSDVSSDASGFDASPEGVHVQWQLPEALTAGPYDPGSGQATFPLVPNRWLVVRYQGPADARQAVGWVVQSDHLDIDGPHGARGTARSLALHDSRTGPAATERRIDLASGEWVEPFREEGPFLTAVGPGLPTFAAYQPYNTDVFSVHDRLDDLRPDDHLRYLVAGWYSDGDAETLSKSAGVGDLLPPDPAGPTPDPARLTGILDALGWQPSGSSQTQRTAFSGTALGLSWRGEADDRP
ncbi:hypothetical protein ACFVVA_23950 [Kitasatospora sp. NPDC058048]|uniref:hypothetical protein n=1 Tax=Kitasatospora sp. NPDC058048 TaxID=3346313 RepID=UPI0036DCB91D